MATRTLGDVVRPGFNKGQKAYLIIDRSRGRRAIAEVTIVFRTSSHLRSIRPGPNQNHIYYYEVVSELGGSLVVPESSLRPGNALDRLALELT